MSIPSVLRPTWEQELAEQGYWTPPFHDLPPQAPNLSTCCVGCPGASKPRCCRHADYKVEQVLERHKREADEARAERERQRQHDTPASWPGYCEGTRNEQQDP